MNVDELLEYINKNHECKHLFWRKRRGQDIDDLYKLQHKYDNTNLYFNIIRKDGLRDCLFFDFDDKENIVNFCNNERLNYKTPYIFRFALADYFSGSFRCVYQDVVDNITYTFTEYLGYCVQENSVIQNFDIIDLTFEKNGRQSIIPVVADPIDIYTDITPPPSVDNDWWEKLIKLLLLLILIFIVIPFIIRLINWFSNVFRFNKSNKSIKKKRKKRK